MKIFISWSGECSKALAEALREWLPGVIQAVKPYFTPDDVTKGSRWNTEISKELEESRVGLICLTRDNLREPWIMFEAGALSKNLDKSRVCPILFGVEPTDIKGPLVQFQAAKFKKEDIKKVVKMINRELGEAGLTQGVLDSVFEMWWPKLDETVKEVLSGVHEDKGNSVRSERDILEEILALSRSLRREPREASRLISPVPVAELIRSYRSIIEETSKMGVLPVFRSELTRMGDIVEYLITRVGPHGETALRERYDEAKHVFAEAMSEAGEEDSKYTGPGGLPL